MFRLNKNQICVTEQILEVRYVPSGKFLDKIGHVASHFVDDLNIFPYWRVDKDTINFLDSDPEPVLMSGFISYKNAGYVCIDPPTDHFFSDKSIAFWKAFNKNQLFPIPKITRVGIRKRCFIKSHLSFSEIRDAILTLFSKNLLNELGAVSKDLQITQEYSIDQDQFRLILGPLNKDEAFKHFKFESEHFSSCGLFIDIDMYIDGECPDVSSYIKKATSKINVQIDKIQKVIGLQI